MKNPLTQKEQKEFENTIIQEFRKEYEKAIESGAFSESDGEKGTYLIAKIAIYVACQGFYPVSGVGREAIKNYEKF